MKDQFVFGKTTPNPFSSVKAPVFTTSPIQNKLSSSPSLKCHCCGKGIISRNEGKLYLCKHRLCKECESPVTDRCPLCFPVVSPGKPRYSNKKSPRICTTSTPVTTFDEDDSSIAEDQSPKKIRKRVSFMSVKQVQFYDPEIRDSDTFHDVIAPVITYIIYCIFLFYAVKFFIFLISVTAK